MIKYDEIINATKTVGTNFNKKKMQPVKQKISIFQVPFVNYYSINDSC